MTCRSRSPSPGASPCDAACSKTCPPCHGDCYQGDTCPASAPLAMDFGSRELRSGLLIALSVWMAVIVGVLAVALLS